MNPADLPLCRHLVQEAGWNQIDADWFRAMELDAEGCFVAEVDDVAVATTTGCCFGETGWIAMVLVDQKSRGQGIAEKLVSHTLRYLESRGVRTVRLDATALGQGLYRKLGFEEEYALTRYAGVPVIERRASGQLESVLINEKDINQIAGFDQNISGNRREAFLMSLARESSSPFYYKLSLTGTISGYAGSRDGGHAVQLGPAAALTGETGRELLDAISSQFAGRTCYIDIPAQNTQAIAWAEINGFTAQRQFVRMFRGERIHDFPKMTWASSGPEKG